MLRPVHRTAVSSRLRRQLAAGGAFVLGLTALAFLPAAPAQALTLPPQCVLVTNVNVTCTFVGAPGSQTQFTVPAGVTSMHVKAVGERGGAALLNGSAVAIGGAPAVVEGTVPVNEGDTINVHLMNDGGTAGSSGSGRVAGRGGNSVSVSRNLSIVAHAAGGGGAGATRTAGGNSSDGGAAGMPGIAGDYSASFGNAPSTGGDSGLHNSPGVGGQGGSIDSCGSPFPEFLQDGQAGGVHRGGNGGSNEFGGFGGGGGGGGRYGGGGGGAGGEGCFTHAYAGGGGGGSSTLMPGGSQSIASALENTYRAVITFTLVRRSSHTPPSINFGNTPVGTQSGFQTFTINNTGSASITLGIGAFGGSQSGQFTKGVDNCSGKTLADGTSCTVQLAHKPTLAGSASATFTITDNSPQSPHIVTLSGTGTQPVALLQATNINFGAAEVGKSADRTIVLGNFGNAPLNVTSAVVGGAHASDYAKTADSCSGKSVAVNSTCSVTVRFTAGAVGSRTGTLTFTHNANPTTSVANLSGIGTPPADLTIRGIGSIYTGRDHLVTRTVPGTGDQMTYPLQILNEDTVARSYRIALGKSGAAAAASVWETGFGAKELVKDGAGNYVTVEVAPGKAVSYNLRVTPTAPGQIISNVAVSLLADNGGLIEGVNTQTNTAAPVNGTSSFELFAKQGSQPFIGGPVSGQTATGPALKVGAAASYTVRLKNNGTSAQQIGLRLTDMDGCAGAFSVTAKVGTRVITAAAFDGTHLTPLLTPGKVQNVTVRITRVAAGCPSKTIRAQSLNGGVAVRSSFELANANYDRASD